MFVSCFKFCVVLQECVCVCVCTYICIYIYIYMLFIGSSLPGYGKPSFETIEFNYLLSDNDHT